MVAAAERMLDGWADGQARDVQEDMMHLAFEIVAKCLFDADSRPTPPRSPPRWT